MSVTPRKLSLAWGLWFHFWLVICTIIFANIALLGTFINRTGNLYRRGAVGWGKWPLRFGRIPVQVEGLELLTPGQNYVYAANHRSAVDIFVLAAILPGKFMWVAKESIFKIPIIGQVLARLGSVPVDRSNLQKAMRSLNLAAARVRGGMSVIIFPEGTRAETPELLPFKKGVFVMAIKAGQPIVPVSISGTMAIQPRGSFRVRPGPVKVVISKPIAPQDFPRKEDLIAAVHHAVAANYDPYFPYGPGGADG